MAGTCADVGERAVGAQLTERIEECPVQRLGGQLVADLGSIEIGDGVVAAPEPVELFGRVGGPASGPVAGNQAARPGWLADLAASGKLGHVRLDVEHRRPVDGIETLHGDGQPVDGYQPADRHPDPVRSRLGPLGEDPHLRPVRVASRAAGRSQDAIGVDPVEEVDDLDVGEAVETSQGLGAEPVTVEADRRRNAVPVVVDRLRPRRAHPTDRSHLHPVMLSPDGL